MRILTPTFPGLLVICQTCGALLQWNEHDLYGQEIYCPICKQPTHIDFDKNYNGEVKSNGEN